uniref:Protein kinase domain-containing protein n=1 Tax=Tetraselmis chuii TaxID=63592 RepID=A0A7S1SR54_9CHLO|mmetsp:Transcript_23674/g.42080  ORF Transcript_23674/g.42080 Transcript_23674/m.42080 type:complete len:308 (+) Transcript_23674:371-1294(+)|eukprot:CAMPEP_0177768734 /NCGR_PEP_ID=MMETSP0491_2-20121128/9889_1 /TAXON_ID=63592 /ORGANISM="Tetraselmis chuii, Strain PLY429" /LENGTH=307 /DNA_ID=CAMNT_0019285581 /DNA_START=331 /DNA_END=1254 /DNA_ORIENTATION=+
MTASDSKQVARGFDLEAPSTTSRPSLHPARLSDTNNFNNHTEFSFQQRYQLGRVIGCGAFSTVRLATDRATGKEWACKTVTEQSERPLLLREVDILQQLDHPNLLQYHEHFDTPENLYIITELLEGSDLLSASLVRGSYSEDDAREIIRQMLSALAYLNSKDVAHRDIKMENVMLVAQAGSTAQVKIIDFGLADQLSQEKPFFLDACGTPIYLAPEVASRTPYGTSCDVWAAGVVLFMMLSGDSPFQGDSLSTLLETIRLAQVRFDDPVWELTSSQAKELLKALLTADPADRSTAEDALAHPWLADE